MGRFENKVALVTGGNSGIGKETAIQFAREGAKVVVAARREDEGNAVVEEIKSAGGEAIFTSVDVANSENVQQMVAQCVETFGGLDYAFNNAGMIGSHRAPIEDYDLEVWERVMAVNVTGVFLCMKYQIPEMLKQGGGSIVNMASISGFKGSSGGAAVYPTTKHAVIGMTKSAALENAKRNIRVNSVCPAVIDTPLVQENLFANEEMKQQIIDVHPIGRIGEPREVAGAVLWLCSDEASFVTGHQMVIDGGLMA